MEPTGYLKVQCLMEEVSRKTHAMKPDLYAVEIRILLTKIEEELENIKRSCEKHV